MTSEMIDELAERFADVLADRLAERLRTQPTERPTPYLNLEEAANYCRLAPKTLYNHRQEITRVPGIGKLLFTKEHLDSWLNRRKKRV